MDTLHTGGADFNPATSFVNYIWGNYISSGAFWGTMIIVFLFLWIGRTFLFDNKNIKLNSTSWFYPLFFFIICFFAVLLKQTISPAISREYFADLFQTVSVICMCYVAFGHKLVTWLSNLSVERLGLKEGYEKKEATLISQADGMKTETTITQTTEPSGNTGIPPVIPPQP